MDLVVGTTAAGWLARLGARSWPCAIGRGGFTVTKCEGDGATPVGCWPFRRVLYRADRVMAPATKLPVAPLAPDDGWCDDVADPLYNQPVRLPYPGRHERLWHEDRLYDVIVILGYNDAPPIAGQGSAIFLHVAGPGYPPTEGCVALAVADLLMVLASVDSGSRICIAADCPRG